VLTVATAERLAVLLLLKQQLSCMAGCDGSSGGRCFVLATDKQQWQQQMGCFAGVSSGSSTRGI
jgi:hypothetical protein